jgi:hypothetical protein
VKTFVGTTANALKTQIWAALIAMLLIRYLQLKSTFGWSLSNLVALLRQQLFVYRDLWVWIYHPFKHQSRRNRCPSNSQWSGSRLDSSPLPKESISAKLTTSEDAI